MAIETYSYFDLPTPEQLFALASIGVGISHKRKNFSKPPKEDRQAEKGVFFIGEDVVRANAEIGFSSYHKYLGRIGKVGFNEWSMFMAEPYWGSFYDGAEGIRLIDGYRETYAFRWTKKEVTRAERKIKTKGGEEEDLLEYGASLNPETIDPEIFEADFVNAHNQYARVTHADCQELINDLRLHALDIPRSSQLRYNR